MKKTSESEISLFSLVLMFLVLMYAMFHVGRYYEHKRANDVVSKAMYTAIYTDYFVPTGENTGEIAKGVCITPFSDGILSTYFDIEE